MNLGLPEIPEWLFNLVMCLAVLGAWVLFFAACFGIAWLIYHLKFV